MTEIQGRITALKLENPRLIDGAIVEQLRVFLEVRGDVNRCQTCPLANCYNNPNSTRREDDIYGEQIRESNPTVVFSRTNSGVVISATLQNANCAPLLGRRSREILAQIADLPANIIPQNLTKQRSQK